jgi:hypothetical protein
VERPQQIVLLVLICLGTIRVPGMPSKMVFHEGKACDAVIRRLEVRAGSSRTRLSSPEAERHVWPLEFTCEIGGQLYAIELRAPTVTGQVP